MTHTAAERPLWFSVVLLGIAQIISWGTLYYSLTVLAIPIERDLAFSKFTIFGSFTIGLLVSGAIAPVIGRRIDLGDSRAAMSMGSVLAVAAMLTVAAAREPVTFTIGWALAGAAMAATLYDPAFASLHQIAGAQYRRAVTGLTLLGGFASTVFWPVSNVLASTVGWRWAFCIFAALHLCVCLPIHLWILPANSSRAKPMEPSVHGSSYLKDRRFPWLAASFACATLVFSAISAFVVTALASRGFSIDAAVAIAALIGPMQVLARMIEWSVARHVSAIAVGIAAFVLSLLGTLLLNVIPSVWMFGVMFAVCYGASNGILTIARGTVPSELFGSHSQGELLGALARPSFFTKAFAPALFAGGLNLGLTIQTELQILALFSTLGLVTFLIATRRTVRTAIASTTDGA
ncbi:MAG TPA: MFS transporter [Steroidobacter sp.]